MGCLCELLQPICGSTPTVVTDHNPRGWLDCSLCEKITWVALYCIGVIILFSTFVAEVAIIFSVILLLGMFALKWIWFKCFQEQAATPPPLNARAVSIVVSAPLPSLTPASDFKAAYTPTTTYSQRRSRPHIPQTTFPRGRPIQSSYQNVRPGQHSRVDGDDSDEEELPGAPGGPSEQTDTNLSTQHFAVGSDTQSGKKLPGPPLTTPTPATSHEAHRAGLPSGRTSTFSSASTQHFAVGTDSQSGKKLPGPPLPTSAPSHEGHRGGEPFYVGSSQPPSHEPAQAGGIPQGRRSLDSLPFVRASTLSSSRPTEARSYQSSGTLLGRKTEVGHDQMRDGLPSMQTTAPLSLASTSSIGKRGEVGSDQMRGGLPSMQTNPLLSSTSKGKRTGVGSDQMRGLPGLQAGQIEAPSLVGRAAENDQKNSLHRQSAGQAAATSSGRQAEVGSDTQKKKEDCVIA